MISLPDFREKQLLFVNTEWCKPSRLRFFNDNIVFEREGSVVNRASVHKVFAVFVCGDLSFTTGFIKKARDYGISVFLLKHNFELYGGLFTTAEGHYVLRSKQYHQNDEFQLVMAKHLVKNKVANQTRAILNRRDKEVKNEWLEKLSATQIKIDTIKDHKELLGIEGNYSKEYFNNYFSEIEWRRRAPRTKEDINNFLLDMGYTLLFNLVDSLLRLHGFDTYKGFYHRLFFQRRSLSCDVMEPIRPLIDSKLLKMSNLKQVNKNDFQVHQGAYMLPWEHYPKYAGNFLQALMDDREDIFKYVHGFYQYVMNDKKYLFPEYQLK
jgi:CRISPR-associated protein Cas1